MSSQHLRKTMEEEYCTDASEFHHRPRENNCSNTVPPCLDVYEYRHPRPVPHVRSTYVNIIRNIFISFNNLELCVNMSFVCVLNFSLCLSHIIMHRKSRHLSHHSHIHQKTATISPHYFSTYTMDALCVGLLI